MRHLSDVSGSPSTRTRRRRRQVQPRAVRSVGAKDYLDRLVSTDSGTVLPVALRRPTPTIRRLATARWTCARRVRSIGTSSTSCRRSRLRSWPLSDALDVVGQADGVGAVVPHRVALRDLREVRDRPAFVKRRCSATSMSGRGRRPHAPGHDSYPARASREPTGRAKNSAPMRPATGVPTLARRLACSRTSRRRPASGLIGSTWARMVDGREPRLHRNGRRPAGAGRLRLFAIANLVVLFINFFVRMGLASRWSRSGSVRGGIRDASTAGVVVGVACLPCDLDPGPSRRRLVPGTALPPILRGLGGVVRVPWAGL